MIYSPSTPVFLQSVVTFSDKEPVEGFKSGLKRLPISKSFYGQVGPIQAFLRKQKLFLRFIQGSRPHQMGLDATYLRWDDRVSISAWLSERGGRGGSMGWLQKCPQQEAIDLITIFKWPTPGKERSFVWEWVLLFLLWHYWKPDDSVGRRFRKQNRKANLKCWVL